jgi:hypothetical protein
MAIGLPKEISQTKKIEILSSVGLAPKEIAEILGTTSNTVSVTLSGIRKKLSETPEHQTAPGQGSSQGALVPTGEKQEETGP